MGAKKNREQGLLLLLAKRHDYVTSEELAEHLGTSQKTIYRLIKKINETHGEGLIQSEKGRGYKLNYEKYISQTNFQPSQRSQYSPQERRNRVMEELLLSSPNAKNVYDLFEEYYVGESVIFGDEQIIAEYLQRYELKLERKQRTLAVLGKEASIRRAISDLIQMHNIVEIDDLKNNPELNFNNYDVLFILDQIKLIEKQLGMTIPYPYNINIFSHLYILISRLRKVQQLPSEERELLSKSEQERLQQDTTLYQVSKAAIQNVEQYLQRELPESEIYYLYQYLTSSRMQGSLSKVTKFSPKVAEITNVYLDGMSQRLNIPIKGDSIFLDLANHIKPMINRLNNGIHVKNSLLDQIKMTYEVIFTDVTHVSDEVSQRFDLPKISEDENGFISLYFARIIETNQLPIRTVIMCTTGVGTSELLRVKVEKKFPELEIVDVIASRDAKRFMERYPGIDLILTTVSVSEAIQVPSLLVSAMFTKDDQNRLQKKIEAIYDER
ncbi:BglG family transcription antiterminator [Enterococcus xiangfangensis]|uniref:PRD domain-containing protein n=1 Tax=Enterococcus xiangfangensis TaxID=1296537 RepID=A0ABU3F891_9ENTE|nr:PRD domain-containing protein [Enterococcus xiangfangensis]MDT2758889.1 PRD domain-containing protein [Enterococcus xiangfangensis]